MKNSIPEKERIIKCYIQDLLGLFSDHIRFFKIPRTLKPKKIEGLIPKKPKYPGTRIYNGIIQSEIVKKTGLDKKNVSNRLNELEQEDGYIYRFELKNKKYVFVTKKCLEFFLKKWYSEEEINEVYNKISEECPRCEKGSNLKVISFNDDIIHYCDKCEACFMNFGFVYIDEVEHKYFHTMSLVEWKKFHYHEYTN